MVNSEYSDALSAHFIEGLLTQFSGLDLLRLHPSPHALTHDRKIIFLNAAAIQLFEGNNAADLLGKDITTLIHPLDHGRILGRLQNLDQSYSFNLPTEQRIYTLSGKVKRITSTSSLLEIGGHTLILVTGTEITASMEHEISASEQNFQRLFENMLDVFYRTDSEQRLTLLGPAVFNMLGYKPEEVIGLPAAAFYCNPEEREKLISAIKKDREIKNFSAQLRHKNGQSVEVEITSKAIFSVEGHFLGMEGIFRDVSEQVAFKKQLHHLATIDELTGILNRRSFIEQAIRTIKNLRRHPQNCLLAVIDLDKFKLINDLHGHLGGDRVLKVFVSFFAKSLRETDIFGRLGGDEFAILFGNCSLDEGSEIFSRILDKMKKISIHMPDAVQLTISASLGLTLLSPEDLPFSRALARADKALYLAKKKGGACFAIEPAA